MKTSGIIEILAETLKFAKAVGPARRAYFNYLCKLLKAKKITDVEHTKLLKLGQGIQAATATFFKRRTK